MYNSNMVNHYGGIQMKPTTASLFLIQRDYCPLSVLLRRAQRQAVRYLITDEAETFEFADGSVLVHTFATECEGDRLYY